MMLMTRDRSLSGRETIQASDYNSFIGKKERSQMSGRNSINNSVESLVDKQTPGYQELAFNSLLKQLNVQLRQQEQDNQNQSGPETPGLPFEGQLYQQLYVKPQLPEIQRHQGDLQSIVLPLEGQLNQHDHSNQHPNLNLKQQLPENQPRRGSFPPMGHPSGVQLHQQEHGSQHPHIPVKHLLPEEQPRRGSLPPMDQLLRGQLHQQEHSSQHTRPDVNDQLYQNRSRRGSLPSEGFKDITILENDYFVAICEDYVKLFSDVGDLVDKLQLDCTPMSLSRLGQDRMVITCYSRRLCVVRIDNGTALSLVLEVETVIQYSSVSQLQNDELICAGLDEAVLHRLVYKANQVVLASVLPLVDFGVTIRHNMSYRYVHVTSSGRILVTDRMNDYLLSLSVKGNWKIPFIYRPQAVVSDDKHIYVIQGGGLNLVYRINLDGTKALCILRKEHGLIDPWGLSLNRNGKLILTSNSEGVPGVRVFTGLVAV